MRRCIFLVVTMFLVPHAFSQMNVPWDDYGRNILTGGAGISWINSQPYYLINFSPELTFGKFGAGLDVNLRFSQDGKIRSEDFKNAYDYFRMIRYIRYGMKREPVYVRLGSLSMATLGYGLIMQWYTNRPSYEYRKIGAEFALDFGMAGVEGLYSDFDRPGVAGARGFVRPLKVSGAGDIPLLGGLETGLTVAADLHSDAGIISPPPALRDTGRITIIGADVGFPILNMPWLNSSIYLQGAKIVNFGSGTAVGIDFNVDLPGLARAGAKIERRFNGEHFIPSYFGPFYELERFQAPPDFRSKASLLVADSLSSRGIYGELRGNIIGAIEFVGALQTFDDRPGESQLHLGARLPQSVPSVYAEAAYDKTHFANFREAFTLPGSLLTAIVGYKPYPFLLLSVLYEWTFTEENGELKRQERIEPRVSFIYTFE